MLARREVRIGKCYVKENTRTVREVIAELYHRKVVYNAYDLRTGKLFRTPHQICSVKQLIRWADREASLEESAKLKRYEEKDLFVDGQEERRTEGRLIEPGKSRSLTEARHPGLQAR